MSCFIAAFISIAEYPQSGAENALQLHGQELEPGHILNVLISNPERKKERTDQDANEREIYVAGLSKFTTKADLEKLFKTVSDTWSMTCYFRIRLNFYFSMEGSRR